MCFQALERGLHILQRLKAIHPLRAAAKLSRSLRTSQQQNAQDRDLPAVEVEYFLQTMFVFRNPAIGASGGSSKALFLKRTERVADGTFVQRHHRIAVIFLIAGVDQCIERQRIVVGSGDVFLN